MSVSYVSRQDPLADEWEVLPDLPERREHCAAGAVKSWTETAPLPVPRAGLAGAVLGQRLFVFGGEGNPEAASGVFPNIDAFDPVANAWEPVEPMTLPAMGSELRRSAPPST